MIKVQEKIQKKSAFKYDFRHSSMEVFRCDTKAEECMSSFYVNPSINPQHSNLAKDRTKKYQRSLQAVLHLSHSPHRCGFTSLLEQPCFQNESRGEHTPRSFSSQYQVKRNNPKILEQSLLRLPQIYAIQFTCRCCSFLQWSLSVRIVFINSQSLSSLHALLHTTIHHSTSNHWKSQCFNLCLVELLFVFENVRVWS